MNKTLEKRISKKIRDIEIRTKKLVETTIGGKYTSAFRGLGIEFNKVREYQPGDDISSVDWNVTARTANDRLYVKEFIEERELQVFLVVDTSASMVYSSLKSNEDDQAPLKIDIAAEVAAVLALSAISNNDKVGLMTFSGAVQEYIPPRKGKKHVLHIIRDILSNAKASGQTKLSSTLENLYGLINTKAIIFIITDFMLGQDDNYSKPLSILAKKHDCIVIRISDPYEENFPNVGLVNLMDPESGKEILVDSSSNSFRGAFKARIEAQKDYHRKILSRTQVDILDLRTDRDYIIALHSFFKQRVKKR
ncbi:DUF58 domain-containing protein [candidate division WOR-3 bacterium]|nr:DUF58 domain-containing protein [candidate division WOR-3 bacterium]